MTSFTREKRGVSKTMGENFFFLNHEKKHTFYSKIKLNVKFWIDAKHEKFKRENKTNKKKKTIF